MAVTLNEQSRIFAPAATDPKQFGDGAPMLSRVPFDMVRMLNNLQTYCEPSFGFVFDISWRPEGSGSNISRICHTRPTASYYDSGMALLGQVPILVPPKAKHLHYSLGFYRFISGFESTIAVRVTTTRLYLASRPVTRLLDPVGVVAPVESGRMFSPTYIGGPYTTDANSLLPAGATDTSTPYAISAGNTWLDFATTDNINDPLTNPWAFLIVAVDFNNMAVGETIQGAELSWWFDYE